MKRFFLTLALVFVAIAGFSQNKLLRPRLEIATLENDTAVDAIEIEVFYMNSTPTAGRLSVPAQEPILQANTPAAASPTTIIYGRMAT